MSLLDFLIDLEGKEIKFYLERYFIISSETRYDLRIIVEGCSFNPVHAIIIEKEDDYNIYVTMSPLPLLSYTESEFYEIKESLKKLIRQLLKDSRVEEKLKKLISSGFKASNERELLFKYIPIDGEIEIY